MNGPLRAIAIDFVVLVIIGACAAAQNKQMCPPSPGNANANIVCGSVVKEEGQTVQAVKGVSIHFYYPGQAEPVEDNPVISGDDGKWDGLIKYQNYKVGVRTPGFSGGCSLFVGPPGNKWMDCENGKIILRPGVPAGPTSADGRGQAGTAVLVAVLRAKGIAFFVPQASSSGTGQGAPSKTGSCSFSKPKAADTNSAIFTLHLLTAESEKGIRRASLDLFDEVGKKVKFPTKPQSDKNGCYEIAVGTQTNGNFQLRVAVAGFGSGLLPIEISKRKLLLYPDQPPPKTDKADVQVRLSPEKEGIESTFELEASRRYAFDSNLIATLPLPGIRNPDDLALLIPGVSPAAPTTGNTIGATSGVGTPGSFAVNGMRPRDNNFTIDGADNNEENVGVRRQGFVALSPVPVESIAEMEVITALADARFGRNIGGQALTLTKSGHPGMHAGVYGMLTDSLWNARNFFDYNYTNSPPANQPFVQPIGSPAKDPFQRFQGGIYLTGKLGAKGAKSPFYVYLAAERQKINASRETPFAVPTVSQRYVTFPPDVGGSSTPSLPGDALFSLIPLPNNPSGPYGPNTYTTELPADGAATLWSLKIDRDLPALKSDLSMHYSFTDDKRVLPDPGGNIASILEPSTQLNNGALFFNTRITPRLQQHARLSYGRTTVSFRPIPFPGYLPSSTFSNDPYLLNSNLLLDTSTSPPTSTASLISAGSSTGQAVLSQIGMAGVTSTDQVTGPLGQVQIAGFSTVGYDVYNFPQQRADNTYQAADELSYGLNKHRIAFGFDIRRDQTSSNIERNYRPKIVFDSQQTTGSGTITPATTYVAEGAPAGMLQDLSTNPDPSLGIHLSQFNFFFHDDWAIRSNFHLSLGLRWEVNTAPGTSHNELENAFNPNKLPGLAAVAQNTCPSVQIYLPPTDYPQGAGGAPTTGRPASCDNLAQQLGFYFPSSFQLGFNADRSNVLPRVGFAWAPDEKTTVRGGFGIYADVFPSIVLQDAQN